MTSARVAFICAPEGTPLRAGLSLALPVRQAPRQRKAASHAPIAFPTNTLRTLGKVSAPLAHILLPVPAEASLAPSAREATTCRTRTSTQSTSLTHPPSTASLALRTPTAACHGLGASPSPLPSEHCVRVEACACRSTAARGWHCDEGCAAAARHLRHKSSGPPSWL